MKVASIYGKLVAERPWMVLLLILAFSLLCIFGVSKLRVGGGGYSSYFSKDEEIIRTMNIVRDEFGGADNLVIIIEIDPSSENDIHDIRDPRVLRYVDTLENRLSKVEKVIYVKSYADLVRENGDLPNSISRIKRLLEKNQDTQRFLSSDYKTTLIRVTLSDVEGEEEKITEVIENVIEEYPPPSGIKVGLTGGPAIVKAIRGLIKPDMRKTSRISLIAIFIIVLIIFRSLKYGFLPLLGVALGSLWTQGIMGLLGIPIKPVTSGAASMILGIGIDFGIQIVNRFKLEIEVEKGREEKERGSILAIVAGVMVVLVGIWRWKGRKRREE